MGHKTKTVAATFYQNYIEKAEDIALPDGLRSNLKTAVKFFEAIPPKKRSYAYAEGKWTIRQLLQHIIDAERVFAYRALRFARKDATPLPGFDENIWAAVATAENRKWKDLLEEFVAVRKASILLYESFSTEELLLEGTASNNAINVMALGYIIPGHVNHHIDILNERYLQKKK